MTQLVFRFPCRWLIPASRMTWREGADIRVVEQGEHSVDFSWPVWAEQMVGQYDGQLLRDV